MKHYERCYSTFAIMKAISEQKCPVCGSFLNEELQDPKYDQWFVYCSNSGCDFEFTHAVDTDITRSVRDIKHTHPPSQQN